MDTDKFIYVVLILFLIIISYVATQETGIISGYASGTLGSEAYIGNSNIENHTENASINNTGEIYEEKSFWEQFLDWLGIK